MDSTSFLDALVRGDRREANRVVDEVIDGGGGLEKLYLEIVQPAMWEVGRLWQENELTVAEEHLATAITQAAMSRAFERVYRWRDARTPSLIAACVDDERHQMGLRMFCDLLELDGWDTSYLGASVPIESLVSIVEKRNPDVVALSATIAPHLPRLRAAIQAVRASKVERQPIIIAGGRALAGDQTLAVRLGADLTAKDAGEAVNLLRERVLKASR
ncbi:MAG TPA: B12-binding domain-containing protein [Gemmatimonadaceae bacterium]|jgi:methanogenic corrinoid protein MtbC1